MRAGKISTNSAMFIRVLDVGTVSPL